jgi:hypothetical protein
VKGKANMNVSKMKNKTSTQWAGGSTGGSKTRMAGWDKFIDTHISQIATTNSHE